MNMSERCIIDLVTLEKIAVHHTCLVVFMVDAGKRKVFVCSMRQRNTMSCLFTWHTPFGIALVVLLVRYGQYFQSLAFDKAVRDCIKVYNVFGGIPISKDDIFFLFLPISS